MLAPSILEKECVLVWIRSVISVQVSHPLPSRSQTLRATLERCIDSELSISVHETLDRPARMDCLFIMKVGWGERTGGAVLTESWARRSETLSVGRVRTWSRRVCQSCPIRLQISDEWRVVPNSEKYRLKLVMLLSLRTTGATRLCRFSRKLLIPQVLSWGSSWAGGLRKRNGTYRRAAGALGGVFSNLLAKSVSVKLKCVCRWEASAVCVVNQSDCQCLVAKRLTSECWFSWRTTGATRRCRFSQN